METKYEQLTRRMDRLLEKLGYAIGPDNDDALDLLSDVESAFADFLDYTNELEELAVTREEVAA